MSLFKFIRAAILAAGILGSESVVLTAAGQTAALTDAAPQTPATPPAQAGTRQEWTVDAVTREALVFAPATAATQPTPLVFAFHAHGGKMTVAAKRMNFQAAWPEAIVVYPQALNTPGGLVDPQGKTPGWQEGPGQEGDRDVKFFDAMLAGLRHQYKVDDKRVYVSGFSSGGGMTYLLWLMRGPELRAVAPACAAEADFPSRVPTLKPKPVFVVAGRADPLIKIEWQVPTIAALVKLNGCDAGQASNAPNCIFYPSKTGTPVISLIHPGGHLLPASAIPLIVKFFKDDAGGSGG